MGKTNEVALSRETEEQIKKEFPGDLALQQVHLARKAIAAAAKQKGLSFAEYVKSLRLRR